MEFRPDPTRPRPPGFRGNAVKHEEEQMSKELNTINKRIAALKKVRNMVLLGAAHTAD